MYSRHVTFLPLSLALHKNVYNKIVVQCNKHFTARPTSFLFTNRVSAAVAAALLVLTPSISEAKSHPTTLISRQKADTVCTFEHTVALDIGPVCSRWDGSVGIVTTMRPGRPGNRGSIPDMVKR